jgi:putative membrane protein
MSKIANVLIGAVALLHIYFLVLEIFLWDKPRGMKTFNLTAEHAAITKSLAANQGLYNGFLAAGLIWGIFKGVAGIEITMFFLGCVVVAGIFGGATVNRKIFFVQALPALIALAVLFLV